MTAPSPHERRFLEGYALGAHPEQIVEQLVHDTRGAWTAERSGADVRVQHHGGARATLVVVGDAVTEVRWEGA